MILVSWNCRRLSQSSVCRTIKALIGDYNPDCIYLMETKLNASLTTTIVHKLGFDLFFFLPPVGSRWSAIFVASECAC